MEYCTVAGALKSSLRRELPATASMMKSNYTQQSLFDDIMFNSSNNSSVEDFSVDCFFDFSNGGEFKDGHVQEQQEEQEHNMVEEEEDDDDDDEEEKYSDSGSGSSRDHDHDHDHDNNSNSCNFDDSFLSGELAVPIDDLAELEWVSQIVDDSSSEFSLLHPLNSENFHAKTTFEIEHDEPNPVFLTKPSSCLFPAKIPSKPRSKRTRPTRRTWSVESLLTDSSSSCSYSSSPVSSSASTPSLVTVQTLESLPSFFQPPLKKPKKKPAAQTVGFTGLIQFQRRCSHCQVQKTPQWRAGPLGAKTLCNACGVRYKSGRLFPEYRPACSPNFSGEVHSNSHRKVLEMRKRKEVAGPASGLSQMVPSF